MSLRFLALALVACSSPVKPTSSPPPPVAETQDAGVVDDALYSYELVALPDGRVLRMQVDASVANAVPVDPALRLGKQGDICDGPTAAHCGPHLVCCYPCGARGCRRSCQPHCVPMP